MTKSTQGGGTGRCLCGAVRYRYEGEPTTIGLCQCERCQRQSGSAFLIGVIFPKEAVTIGGTLALVQNGDMIELNVAQRSLHLDVAEAELARRRAAWQPPVARAERGYVQMYIRHVQQANTGVDLDFLVGKSGAVVDRETHV